MTARGTALWLGGPLIWAAHFLAVYATESIVCSRGLGAGAHGLLIAVTTAAALAGIAAILTRTRRDVDEASVFLSGSQRGMALLAGLAIAWTAIPAALISSCTPPA